MEAKKPVGTKGAVNLGMIALGKVNTLEKRIKKLEQLIFDLETMIVNSGIEKEIKKFVREEDRVSAKES